MTALDLINRALRLCKVLDAGQAATGNDAHDALVTMSAMLEEWEAAGFGFTAPTYTTTASAITLPSEDHEAVAYNLATRVAVEYGVDPSPLMPQAAQLLSRLHARYNAPTY